MVTEGLAAAVGARLERLRRYLSDSGLVLAIVSRPEHLRYLTGGPLPGAAFLAVTQQDAVLIAPRTENPSGLHGFLGIEDRPYLAYRAEALVEGADTAAETAAQLIMKMTRGSGVAIELHHLPASVAAATRASHFANLTATLREWRSIKDPWEQMALRHSVRLVEQAFAAAAQLIRPGLSDLAIEAAVREVLTLGTAEPVVMASNIASGPHTAEPDPHPSGRVLEDADLVLLDLYPTLDGYVADLTRTLVVGEPAPDQRSRAKIVASVLIETEAMLRPGTVAGDIDRAVRGMLLDAAADLPPMPHHTGHGIGLLPWEEPWIGRDSERILVPGQAVAVEPGLYLEGWGGIRFEANYLITGTGCERLDSYPMELAAAPAT